MNNRKTALRRGQTGQSLVETVLMLPLLLLLLLNAVNFGYFFLVTLNVTAAPRNGVEYSIMGSATPAATVLPNTGPITGTGSQLSVGFLTYEDMRGALSAPTGNGTLQICSSAAGLTNLGTPNQKALCDTYGPVLPAGFSFPASVPDPELNSSNTFPAFVLNRVDVFYQFIPLIPGTPFNIFLMASPICTSTGGDVRCTFHRTALMRVMGGS
jgi:Flp pilus assembly protein TadG